MKKTKTSTFPPLTNAELEALPRVVSILRRNGFDSILEAHVFARVLSAPATLAEINREVNGPPFSTLSRVAFSLEQRGFLKYTPHPSDRRKKIIVAVVEKLR